MGIIEIREKFSLNEVILSSSDHEWVLQSDKSHNRDLPSMRCCRECRKEHYSVTPSSRCLATSQGESVPTPTLSTHMKLVRLRE